MSYTKILVDLIKAKMNPIELRIGNWIQYNDESYAIVELLTNQVLIRSDPKWDECLLPKLYSELQPTLLNHNILEECCGFRHFAGYYFDSSRYVRLSKNIATNAYSFEQNIGQNYNHYSFVDEDWSHIVDVLNLHHLQNLYFSITGIELEVRI